MADTASLIARVKTDGVEQATSQLDDFSSAAANADSSASSLTKTTTKVGTETKKAIPPLSSYSAVTEQLGNKIAILETAQTEGARSAAILAAQLKAGSTASAEEVQRIGDLTARLYDLSAQQAKVVPASKAANDGIGNFKNTAQQAGYQIQDLVVQLQGGTSAFVAIGQQGSQLAGAFGPGGAVLGAVIALASAVGGVLYKSMTDAGDGAKDLEKATRSLQGVLKEGSNGAQELTDDFLKLAEASNAAAQAKLAASMADANTQIKAAGKAAADASQQFDSFFTGNVFGASDDLKRLTDAGMDTASVLQTIGSYSSASSERVNTLRSYVNDLSGELGISKEQALGLVDQLKEVQQTKSPEAVKSLADTMANLQSQYGATNPKLAEFNDIIQQAVVQMMNGKTAAEALKGAYDNLAATVDKLKAKQAAAGDAFVASIEIQSKRGKELIQAQIKQQEDAINQREGLSDQQRKDALAANKKAGDLELSEFDANEKKKNDKADAAAQKRGDSAAKRAENEAARQKQQADAFIASIQKQSGDELQQIDTTEQQKLEKLDKYRQEGAISDQAYEDTKTQIQLNAEADRQEQLAKLQAEDKKNQDKLDKFNAGLAAMNESELESIDIQQKAKESQAKDFYDRGLTTEEQYQAQKNQIASGYDKKRLNEYGNVLGETTDNLKASLGEGNKAYKAFAIANAVMQTYVGAVAAFQSAAAIPIVGWVAAPIAAAAAIAAGLANVAKIRSAREQGGNLAAGQISTIAERGQPEVIMPAGASRVRTAQQMRQIMGENGSSMGGTPNVQIVNQTSGRVDSVTTEQTDENRLRVIIRETVSSDLGDSNSSISKMRRGTRGQPGH